jgi:AGZA family xanthine/uracil permease-like MFS transporter
MSGPVRARDGEQIIAGVTTFFAMSYIVFVNPTLMAKIGIPPEATFVWTCLAAAAATAVAGWRLALPTALACGMGLNTFEAAFAEHNQMAWPTMMATCFVVGVIVLVLSVSGLRRRMIAAIPPQIFSAIYAGVGAVLASVALKEANRFAQAAGEGLGWSLFVGGIIAIVAVKVIYARWTMPDAPPGAGAASAPAPSWAMELLNSSAFLISILLVWAATAALVATPTLPRSGTALYAWSMPGAFDQITIDDKAVTFGIAVLFILLLDLAGGPFDFVRHKTYGAGFTDAEREEKIRAGFVLDAGANVVAPILGLPPMVYYLENNAGWQTGGCTGLVAKTVAALFLACAVFGVVCLYAGVPIAQFIPAFCIMPTLFFVGLMVIGESFTKPADDPVDSSAPGFFLYFVPAGVTTVAASLGTLDSAIAMGILAFMLISFFPRRYLGLRAPPDQAPLMVVYLGAALVLWLSLRSDMIHIG